MTVFDEYVKQQFVQDQEQRNIVETTPDPTIEHCFYWIPLAQRTIFLDIFIDTEDNISKK